MAVPSLRELLGAQPSTATAAESALIIIDAQNEYAEGKLKTTNVQNTRKAIAGLLAKYRKDGGKVVHIVHQVPEGAPVFTQNTKLAEEYEELAPKDGEKVIGKIHPSSFADTQLHEYLKESGATKIVLCGYMVRKADGLAKTEILTTLFSGSRMRLHDGQRWSETRLRCLDRGGRSRRSRYSGGQRSRRNQDGDA